MLRVPHRRIVWSNWLLLLALRPPGCRRRRPAQARAQLFGHDLDDGAGTAVLVCPGPLLEAAHDHDPAALGQGLAGVLGLVAPHDHGEERRLLLSRRLLTATRNMALAMLLSVCRSSGSSVRLPAKLTLGSVMVLPLSVAWPGGLPCP
jgi:hypothetical protein